MNWRGWAHCGTHKISSKEGTVLGGKNALPIIWANLFYACHSIGSPIECRKVPSWNHSGADWKSTHSLEDLLGAFKSGHDLTILGRPVELSRVVGS